VPGPDARRHTGALQQGVRQGRAATAAELASRRGPLLALLLVVDSAAVFARQDDETILFSHPGRRRHCRDQ
jgi:hypothetical protein